MPRASCTPEKYKIPRPPVGSIHPENLVRMPCTVFTPESRKLDRQTEGREGGRDDRKCQLIPPPPVLDVRQLSVVGGGPKS